MRSLFRMPILAAVLIAGAASAGQAADAAAAPTLKRGALVFSADSKRIGRIDYVGTAKDGTPADIAVIYQSKIIHIPVSTLSNNDRGVVTTLAAAELK